MSTPTVPAEPTTPDSESGCTCDCCAEQDTTATTVSAPSPDPVACGPDCACAA